VVRLWRTCMTVCKEQSMMQWLRVEANFKAAIKT
jgi:hypothetical protein